MKMKDPALEWARENARAYRLRIALLTAGNILYSLCGVIFALLCRAMINSAVRGDGPMMAAQTAGLAVLVAVQLVLYLLCGSGEEALRARLEVRLRKRVLEKVLKKEYSAIAAIPPAELQNRVFTDVTIASNGIAELLPSLAGSSARLIAIAAALLALDVQFALLCIAAGLALFIFARVFGIRVRGTHREVLNKENSLRSFLRETTGSLLSLKSFGAEKKILEMSEQKHDEHRSARMRRCGYAAAANAGFSFIFKVGYLYAALWCALGIFNGTMSFGTLAAVLQLIGQAQAPCAGLSSLSPRYTGMLSAADRLLELEELPDEEKNGRTLPPDDFERLAVSELCFGRGESLIINGASFELLRGETAALSGADGAGKTALLMLLLGAYVPSSGAVGYFSDTDVFNAGRETRGLFAYVSSKSPIFSGTVSENIAFLNESARTDEIRSAAKTACALEFIEALPNGFDTVIGDGGTQLTEAEIQRIAIARAVLGGAPFLLLDEAASALEESAEAAVLRNIGELGNRTLIAVTNRSAAVEACQRSLTLHDGKIYEKRAAETAEKG